MGKWLRLGLLAGWCACAGRAVDWKALQPQGYVSDFAGAIDPASRAQLEAYGGIVEQSTGAQMALVTVASLEGEPIEDVANTIFRAWGVGQKGKNEGILLLLSIGDRRSRLEVGYGLEPILPDGLAGSILREMRTPLRQGDYGDGMMAAAETIGNTIAKAKNVELRARLPRRARPSVSGSFPWPVAIGGVFFLLLLLSRGGRGGGGGLGILPWLILGNMGGSMGSGRGSGGFGGFDSGGGFGGFGGGDSGGGGASGNW
jgi:uncharacterized protein